MTRLLIAALTILLVPPPADLKEARKLLDDALDGGETSTIVEGVRKLAATGEPKAVEILVRKTAFHDSLEVREATLEALANLSDDEAIDALVKEASGRKPEQVAVLLRSLVGRDSERLRRLVGTSLRSKDWRVRLAGLRVRAKFPGEEVTRDIERLLKDDHPRVAHEAATIVDALGGSWPEGVARPEEGEILPRGIPAHHVGIVYETSDGMTGTVTMDDDEVDLVVALGRKMLPALDDLPRGTRVNLVQYSGRIRQCFEEPEPMKKATREEVVSFVDEARGDYGSDVWVAIDRALRDEDLDTLYVVGSGPPIGGEVTETDEVARRLRDANFYRDIVVHTVHIPAPRVPGEGGKAMLERLASENRGTFRQVALAVSGGAGAAPPKPATPETPEEPEAGSGGFTIRKEKGRIPEKEWKRARTAFDEAIRKGRGSAAVEIVRVVAEADDERAVEAVIDEALFHENLEMAEAAEKGLQATEDEDAVGLLLRSARAERDPGRRIVYCRVLAGLEGEEVGDDLVKFLRKGIPAGVRSAAMTALAGRTVPKAIPALERIVDEEHARLSAEAAALLRDMGEGVEDFPAASRDGFFPTTIYGDGVAIAMDTYSSMSEEVPPIDPDGGGAGTRIAVAAAAVRQGLGRLAPRSKFNVYRYGIRLQGWQDEVVPPTKPNVERASKWVEGVRTDPGGRDLRGMLLRLIEDEEIDTIYVLTDGVAAEGRAEDLGALRAEVRGRNRLRNVRIHTILIHPEPPADAVETLRALAEDGGGSYHRYP